MLTNRLAPREAPRAMSISLVLLVSLLVAGHAHASACHGGCDVAHDLVQDRAGRILVAGGSEGPSAVDVDLTLLRLNDDGTPDATFGSGGVVSDLNEGAAIGVTVTSDGTIIATRLSRAGIAVRRYGQDGEAIAPEVSWWPNL